MINTNFIYVCPRCGAKQSAPTEHCNSCYQYNGKHFERWGREYAKTSETN